MNETAPETALRATETGDDRERLAALEHARWSKWQRWLHDQCRLDDRTHALMIPATLVARWEQQIATPYAELTEREKDSDRYEADVTLAALREAGWVDPEEAARRDADLKRLTDVILAIPGEPASEGGAVDVAIRLITEAQTRYASNGAWAEAEGLIAERDALLPVVEAAKAWRAANRHLPPPHSATFRVEQLHALAAAVDALNTQEQP